MIATTDLLVMWSFILLYTLWRTNSLKTSITTTAMVAAVIITGILHHYDYLLVGLLVLMSTMTVLVWRVIPHDKSDTWNK